LSPLQLSFAKDDGEQYENINDHLRRVSALADIFDLLPIDVIDNFLESVIHLVSHWFLFWLVSEDFIFLRIKIY
jgi:hypothetical protein|tara:strand:+ start:175 stop:396 length:222 start_codon:yes stop_codon:yes gene_type:complete